MSKRSVGSSNPILTNFAAGLAPELSNPLADFIAPRVQVPATIGHFKNYDDKNAFQVYNTARTEGGDRRRISFNATDPTFNCLPEGLETTISDDELDAAGEDVLGLEQAKTRVLLGAAQRSRQAKIFSLIDTAKAATAGLGVWSDPGIDPVAQIDSLIAEMAISTGLMPNRLIIDITPWLAFRNHPKVKARITGIQAAITPEQAISFFAAPLQLRIGAMPKDSTKEGKTKANVSITANKVFLFYASDMPDQYDPSFAKSFQGGRGGVTSVGRGRDNTKPYDVLWVDWSEDVQVVSAECGRKLDIT